MAVKAQGSVTVYDFNDISKVRTWYKLVPRTSSAPTVAANATEAQMTSNGWTTTEPAVDTAKKLYTVQQNIFGDGSYVWGEVSLSSSYEAAIQAYNKASAAEGAANETAKYFWFISNDSGAGEGAGAHITEKTKEAFIADPANGGGNVLIDSDSIDVRNGKTALATFGANGSIIRAKDGIVIASLGYGASNIGSSVSQNPYFTFGSRKAVSVYNASSSYSVGDLCYRTNSVSSETYYQLYCCITPIVGGEAWNSAHWLLVGTAEHGAFSVVEGQNNLATGVNAHIEGSQNIGRGENVHIEGSGNVDFTKTYNYTGLSANNHIEGVNNFIAGFGCSACHIEGDGCWVAEYSDHQPHAAHVSGYHNRVGASYQTVIGKFNKADAGSSDVPEGNFAFIIGNGTADNARSNALTVDWSGNVNIASGAKYKINGTNLGAGDVSAVALADKYKRSSAGDLNWSSTTEGDAKVIAKSALAFWNGAYSGNSSNLSKCSAGTIIGSNGGTMTGQLHTSFKTSVAMGSYGSAQTTVNGLAEEIRFSSGCAGSANITTAYTKDGVTIPTGWYNFMYMPHRSGGKNGAADGDNAQYGNLFLFGMNNTNGRFVVRVSSGSIAEVVKLVTTADIATSKGTTSITTSTGSLVTHSIARNGKMRTLFLRAKNSSAINAGSNVYTGTIATASDRPAVWANGVGYYGSAGIMFQIKDTGEITGRVIGAQLAANAEVYASLTYLVS